MCKEYLVIFEGSFTVIADSLEDAEEIACGEFIPQNSIQTIEEIE